MELAGSRTASQRAADAALAAELTEQLGGQAAVDAAAVAAVLEVLPLLLPSSWHTSDLGVAVHLCPHLQIESSVYRENKSCRSIDFPESASLSRIAMTDFE